MINFFFWEWAVCCVVFVSFLFAFGHLFDLYFSEEHYFSHYSASRL